MGIPSYYKRLTTNIKGVVNQRCNIPINWLWMDFNCAIYHCLRNPDIPPYPGDDKKDEWEAVFIQTISRYCLDIVKRVCPTDGVFIAIDGIVPMAKMKQQRMRRFKSVWLRQNGLDESSTPGPKWDTNAITPGTRFMDKLHKQMTKLVKSKKGWSLSSSFEAGEGEHKIMEKWRTGAHSGSYAVYGLDADLIVLSLLNKRYHPVWLFREEIENGEIQKDSDGTTQFCWFDIGKLEDTLFGTNKNTRCLLDYCFAMSFLGNDFIPSPIGFKIREDGHEAMLEILREMWKTPGGSIYLIESDGKTISQSGLLHLIGRFAESEERRIKNYAIRKVKQKAGLAVPDICVGNPDWPIYACEESVLLHKNHTTDFYSLVVNWQHIYLTRWFKNGNIYEICAAYIHSLQWNWSYYIGDCINLCYNWYYPWNLPPLWSWLLPHCTAGILIIPRTAFVRKEAIKPEDHLSLVLPLESWSLLHGSKNYQLPRIAPWMFPSSYEFSSVGKRWFWETEAEIPIVSPGELKKILNSNINEQ